MSTQMGYWSVSVGSGGRRIRERKSLWQGDIWAESWGGSSVQEAKMKDRASPVESSAGVKDREWEITRRNGWSGGKHTTMPQGDHMTVLHSISGIKNTVISPKSLPEIIFHDFYNFKQRGIKVEKPKKCLVLNGLFLWCSVNKSEIGGGRWNYHLSPREAVYHGRSYRTFQSGRTRARSWGDAWGRHFRSVFCREHQAQECMDAMDARFRVCSGALNSHMPQNFLLFSISSIVSHVSWRK